MFFWPPGGETPVPSVYQCFQMGKGSNEQNPPLVGASPSWRGSFSPACTSPADAVRPFSTAVPLLGFSQQFPRTPEGATPSSLLYTAQSRTCWNHSNPILCGLSLRGGPCLYFRPPGVLQNGLSEESLDHKGSSPFPPTPQLAPPDGWNTPSNASPLLPRLPAHDGKLNSIFTNVRRSHIHWNTELRFIPRCLAAREDRLRGREMMGGRSGNQVECEERTQVQRKPVSNRDAGTRCSNKPCCL